MSRCWIVSNTFDVELAAFDARHDVGNDDDDTQSDADANVNRRLLRPTRWVLDVAAGRRTPASTIKVSNFDHDVAADDVTDSSDDDDVSGDANVDGISGSQEFFWLDFEEEFDVVSKYKLS